MLIGQGSEIVIIILIKYRFDHQNLPYIHTVLPSTPAVPVRNTEYRDTGCMRVQQVSTVQYYIYVLYVGTCIVPNSLGDRSFLDERLSQQGVVMPFFIHFRFCSRVSLLAVSFPTGFVPTPRSQRSRGLSSSMID